MPRMQNRPGLSHPCQQGVNDFHSVLRGRKNAMVFLKHKLNAFVFEPLPSASLIKGAEEPLHKFVSTRISG